MLVHSRTRLAGDLRTFFFRRGKVRKNPIEFLHLRRRAIGSMRKLWNSGLGENLEDLGELECQRSAPQCAVLGENLEDLYVDQENRR